MRAPFASDADPASLAANARLLWTIIAAMLLALCCAYWAAGLSVDLASGRFMLGLPLLCAAGAWFYQTQRPDPAIHFSLTTVSQLLLILIGGTLLTYAAAATGLPYRDSELMAADRAFGLDWRSGLDLVNAHWLLGIAAHTVYFSMKPQPLVVLGAMLITGRFARLQHFAAALALTLIITIAVFMLVPAVGVFAHLQLSPADSPNFVPSMTYQEMLQLDGIRSGALRTVRFDALEGLISFPSFHTAAAVLATWAVWPVRRLRWFMLALNVAMVAAVPVDGAHYFVDVPAGAVVAAASIILAAKLLRLAPRLMPQRREKAALAA